MEGSSFCIISELEEFKYNQEFIKIIFDSIMFRVQEFYKNRLLKKY